MPELPEVETIKRGLQTKIVGLTIKSIEVLNPKSFQGDEALLRDAKITGVWRRAKVLGIELESSLRGDTPKQSRQTRSPRSSLAMTLLFHLKMSGQIIFQGTKSTVIGGHPTKDMTGEMPNKSTRVIFKFSDGSKLYFNDQRKFGWVKLVSQEELAAVSFLNLLGPEPLEEGFTWQILKQNLLRHKNVPIKVAILDQTTVSGVGNIYACEACFNAKIHPTKKVSQLTDKDFQKLHQGIIDALTLSIAKGGSSKQHYFNEAGEKGYFLDFAFVYDRAGQPCKVCQTPIEKIKLGGRGTYFCPICQGY